MYIRERRQAGRNENTFTQTDRSDKTLGERQQRIWHHFVIFFWLTPL
jgi:hypothetical protein